MWYVRSNRDEDVYEDPDRFDVHRNPEHQAFGAGGRHFCLGTALARLELRILFEETLRRFPTMELDGRPDPAISPFINQLRRCPLAGNPTPGVRPREGLHPWPIREGPTPSRSARPARR